jgi:hypothetical protein
LRLSIDGQQTARRKDPEMKKKLALAVACASLVVSAPAAMAGTGNGNGDNGDAARCEKHAKDFWQSQGHHKGDVKCYFLNKEHNIKEFLVIIRVNSCQAWFEAEVFNSKTVKVEFLKFKCVFDESDASNGS